MTALDRIMIAAALAVVVYAIFRNAGEHVGLCLIVLILFFALASVLVALARGPALPRRNPGGF